MWPMEVCCCIAVTVEINEVEEAPDPAIAASNTLYIDLSGKGLCKQGGTFFLL